MADKQKKKGSRKAGRNRAKCDAYRLGGKRERNKRIREERRQRRLDRARERREQNPVVGVYIGAPGVAKSMPEVDRVITPSNPPSVRMLPPRDVRVARSNARQKITWEKAA